MHQWASQYCAVATLTYYDAAVHALYKKRRTKGVFFRYTADKSNAEINFVKQINKTCSWHKISFALYIYHNLQYIKLVISLVSFYIKKWRQLAQTWAKSPLITSQLTNVLRLSGVEHVNDIWKTKHT